MGWVTQPEDPNDPVNALFALAPGEVSDAVAGSGGYFIYKNEEERMSTPEEGAEAKREVHGRRIFIATPLEPAARTALVDQAQAVLEAAREAGDLSAAASEAGLAVSTTDWFQQGDTAIEGLPSADVFSFAQALDTVEAEGFAEVVQSSRNIYVAKVVEFEQGEIPPLEEVRETVRQNAINTLKRGEAYLQRVAELAEEIKEKATSLEHAKELYPELAMEIQETAEFNVKETTYVSPIFVPAMQLYQLVGDKEPGALAGPVSSFIGDTFLIELVSKTLPTEEDKANWPAERDEIREGLREMSENAYFHDFRLHLRNSGLYPYQQDDQALARILGLDEAETTPTVDLEMETASPATDTADPGEISITPESSEPSEDAAVE
jgi:hypothetical protein